MFRKALVLGFIVIFTALPVLAQSDPNTPTVLDIQYDAVVHDTITSAAFYDWWTIEASANDDIVIDMAAGDGLQPLIGILDGSGDLVARSDDGEANATVTLEYVIPTAGHYTIVATRVGNADGTSTGTYSLRLRRANSPVVNTDPYQDVTFPCKDQGFEATTAATIAFQEDPTPNMQHRITVYGIDGFRPVIRVNFDGPNAQPFEVCNIDAEFTVGDTFTLPGEDTRTITADNLDTVSQLVLSGAEKMGLITVTIGSKDGQPGRYVAVFEGFAIEPNNDADAFEVRIGPLAAKTTSITAYMVAGDSSRLDPFMTLPESGLTCDDAGRGDCSTVASIAHAGVVLHDGGNHTVSYIGDRSDAGILINPGNPDPVGLQLSSRSGDTHGAYALILIGQLPPRQP
jgi:hypothetical protein